MISDAAQCEGIQAAFYDLSSARRLDIRTSVLFQHAQNPVSKLQDKKETII